MAHTRARRRRTRAFSRSNQHSRPLCDPRLKSKPRGSRRCRRALLPDDHGLRVSTARAARERCAWPATLRGHLRQDSWDLPLHVVVSARAGAFFLSVQMGKKVQNLRSRARASPIHRNHLAAKEGGWLRSPSVPSSHVVLESAHVR